MENKKTISIFASGTGSNAIKLIERARNLAHYCKIKNLICNVEDAPIIKKAKKLDVNVEIIPSKGMKREEHDHRVSQYLKDVDWIFLAGYMRILSPVLLNKFKDNGFYRIVNIHPSLLPKYPGLNAYEKAFESKDEESGITIHLVDEGVDTGPVLLQRSFKRTSTIHLFKEMGLFFEHKYYPKVLEAIVRNTNDDLDSIRNGISHD